MENILIGDVWTVIIKQLEEDSVNHVIALKSTCKYAYQLVKSCYPLRKWVWNQLDMIFEQAEELFLYYYRSNTFQWTNDNVKIISYMLGRTGGNGKVINTLARDGKVDPIELLCGAIRSSNIEYINQILKHFKISLTDDHKEDIGDLALASLNIECFKHLITLEIIDSSLESLSLGNIVDPYLKHEQLEKDYEFDDTDLSRLDTAITFLTYLLSVNPNLGLDPLLETAIGCEEIKMIAHLLINYTSKLTVSPRLFESIIKIGDVELVKLLKGMNVTVPMDLIVKTMSSSIPMVEYFCSLETKPFTPSYLLPIKRNRLDIVKYLYERGTPIDNTLVVQAMSYYEDNEIINYLLSLGLRIPDNIYDSVKYFSCEMVKFLSLRGIPPTRKAFEFLVNDENEKEALELLKLCESKGHFAPQDISLSYFAPSNKDCLALKYLDSKGYPIQVPNLIHYMLGNSNVKFDFLITRVTVTHDDILKLFRYSVVSAEKCNLCISVCKDDLTYIYDNVEEIANLNLVVELQRVGIHPPKHVLDKVHFFKLEVVHYFISKCYPVSSIRTNAALEYVNEPKYSSSYLRYIWNNTDYEFTSEITCKLTSMFGERPQSLDVVMRDYIANL